MGNPIKYSTLPQTETFRKGNYHTVPGSKRVEVPTSVSGWWAGANVPVGGYVLYINKVSGGPAVYIFNGDADLIEFTNNYLGQSYTLITEVLAYWHSVNDALLVDKEYEHVVMDGLAFSADAGYLPSYPRTGTNMLTSTGASGFLRNGATYRDTVGGLIEFDGANDIITFAAPLPEGQTKYSIEAFFRARQLKPQVVFEQKKRYWSPGRRACMFLNGNGLGGFTGLAADFLNAVPYSINTWYHWVITVDTTLSLNRLKFYRDGVFYNQGNQQSGTGLYLGTDIASIGGNFDGGEYFNGDIPIVRVYNSVLTPEEIAANFNAQRGRFGL